LHLRQAGALETGSRERGGGGTEVDEYRVGRTQVAGIASRIDLTRSDLMLAYRQGRQIQRGKTMSEELFAPVPAEPGAYIAATKNTFKSAFFESLQRMIKNKETTWIVHNHQLCFCQSVHKKKSCE
jgi:hypothetical protein